MPENSENRTPITAQDLEHWFPHLQKMSDLELAFVLQGFGVIGLEARKQGLLYADDLLSRLLLVLEAVMHDRGYLTFKALGAAVAMRRQEGKPVEGAPSNPPPSIN
jgi:hypothetical protein